MVEQLPWIENPYDSKFWSIVSGVLCLYFLREQHSNFRENDTPIVGCWKKFRQKFPVGLSLFLLGVLLAFLNLANTKNTNDTEEDLLQSDSGSSTSEALFVNALEGATWEDWKLGFLEGTLPQLPLTTLNSRLSVCLSIEKPLSRQAHSGAPHCLLVYWYDESGSLSIGVHAALSWSRGPGRAAQVGSQIRSLYGYFGNFQNHLVHIYTLWVHLDSFGRTSKVHIRCTFGACGTRIGADRSVERGIPQS